MPSTRQTKNSTQRLSELARHVIVPDGVTSTGWPSVRDQCGRFGVRFDPWQDGAGKLILAKRADGTYAATVGGIVMSIPRQVGKTYLIGAIVFALCLLHPGIQVIWTSHHSMTSGETFRSMKTFARRKRVAPHVGRVLEDDQWVEFHNGSRIMFGARERGFGRGMTNIGMLVFDEAQILSERALTDMLPAQNTAQNPLLFFMGTPPRPSDPSEVFARKRADALSGEDLDTAYIEFSADQGADPGDRKQWAKANPSYPLRTPETAMLRMIKGMLPDSVLREAMGIWNATTTGASVISPDLWSDLATDTPPLTGTLAYGVKFSPDGETAALSVALRPDDGPVHLEAVAHITMADGTKWLEDWLVTRWRKSQLIVIDGKSHAGALVFALRQRGVPARRILRPTVDEVVTAHTMIVDAATAQTITHIGDDAIQAAVGSAGRRPIGKAGGWGFTSIDGGDVTLLEAITFAHYGVMRAKQSNRSNGSPGRRAVVM